MLCRKNGASSLKGYELCRRACLDSPEVHGSGDDLMVVWVLRPHDRLVEYCCEGTTRNRVGMGGGEQASYNNSSSLTPVDVRLHAKYLAVVGVLCHNISRSVGVVNELDETTHMSNRTGTLTLDLTAKVKRLYQLYTLLYVRASRSCDIYMLPIILLYTQQTTYFEVHLYKLSLHTSVNKDPQDA